MIKVAGAWELGYSTPLVEFDHWAFMLRDFGVAEWYMSPVSGINKKVTELKDILESIDLNPNLTPVFVDEDGQDLLPDFEHPENALYLLGKASYSPWVASNRVGLSVRIPTQAVNPSKGLLWPHQAIAITLYDRLLKS